jgi:hypothetical protein
MNFFIHLSTEEVLISPRELQMMALLVSSYCEQHPKANAQGIAQYYAYQITKPLVPTAYREAFKQKFKEPQELVRPTLIQGQSEFIITPSRQKIKSQLDDLLRLRHYRKQHHANDSQKYGGLGGIILDGEPGIGKSELVTHTLTQQGSH